MSYYLVTGSTILNDAIYLAYGGQTGTSTAAQRQAAYQIAEQFAIAEVGTFLVPTTFTQTNTWPQKPIAGAWRMQLQFNRLVSVTTVTAKWPVECTCETVDITGCAWIVDYDNGVVDLSKCGGQVGTCNCAQAQMAVSGGLPKLVSITYVAGIAAGQVAANAAALQGLTIAAQLALEQIYDPAAAEGGPGDPSVENYGDRGYSEKRQYLYMTAFGGSPLANYAARMLKPLKYHGAMRLH